MYNSLNCKFFFEAFSEKKSFKNHQPNKCAENYSTKLILKTKPNRAFFFGGSDKLRFSFPIITSVWRLFLKDLICGDWICDITYSKPCFLFGLLNFSFIGCPNILSDLTEKCGDLFYSTSILGLAVSVWSSLSASLDELLY